MSPYEDDRLPGHERRRRELLTLLDVAEQPRRRTRVVVPFVAAGAVLAASGIGVVIADPWGGGRQSTVERGATRGQDPSMGVPKESARWGDPVPWDIATATLKSCLRKGREGAPPRAASMPPTQPPNPRKGMPSMPTEVLPPKSSPVTPPESPSGPLPLPTGTMYLPKSSSGPLTPPPGTPPSGMAVADRPLTTEEAAVEPPPLMDDEPPVAGLHQRRRQAWEVTEADSAFKPYFTAWEPDGRGSLRPYVMGRAKQPTLVVCHGDNGAPDAPAPSQPDQWILETIETTYGVVYGPPPADNHVGALVAQTLWGRAIAEVAKVEAELPDGSRHVAALRDGVWFISIPTPGSKESRVRIRAYDASGAELPTGDGAPYTKCYRTPAGVLLSQFPLEGAQDISTCIVAKPWQ
ncbi:hypothetical protein [Embleya sp. NBC_00896]|uniref:hypothetical protein n=1 Tax=Embleya sp. NBC_00896 TaxID=2975961 RepID=UPI003863C787|nr:hypothetical protein OG928_04240 [Embleya sp. NBC_00896]